MSARTSCLFVDHNVSVIGSSDYSEEKVSNKTFPTVRRLPDCSSYMPSVWTPKHFGLVVNRPNPLIQRDLAWMAEHLLLAIRTRGDKRRGMISGVEWTRYLQVVVYGDREKQENAGPYVWEVICHMDDVHAVQVVQFGEDRYIGPAEWIGKLVN